MSLHITIESKAPEHMTSGELFEKICICSKLRSFGPIMWILVGLGSVNSLMPQSKLSCYAGTGSFDGDGRVAREKIAMLAGILQIPRNPFPFWIPLLQDKEGAI